MIDEPMLIHRFSFARGQFEPHSSTRCRPIHDLGHDHQNGKHALIQKNAFQIICKNSWKHQKVRIA